MSLLEKLNTKVNIRTGDGKTYDVDCVKIGINPKHDYNISVFEFPNREGSYAERWLPKGVQFSLEIVFHGQNHIEEADTFLQSARDSRYWVLTHPFYGVKNVQPLNINVKDDISTSFLEIALIETIVLSNEKLESVSSMIDNSINSIMETGYLVSSNTIPNVTERNNIAIMVQAVVGAVSKFSGLVNSYTSRVSSMLNTIHYVESNMANVLDGLYSIINIPNEIAMETNARVNAFKDMFDGVVNTIDRLATTNPLKDMYIAILMNILSQQAIAITGKNSTSKYTTRQQLLWYLNSFNGMANTIYGLMDNVGFISFTNNNVNDKAFYSVNPSYSIQLNYLVSIIGKNQKSIIQSGLQSRTYTLTKDMSLVVLTHYLIGLTDAENIEVLNNINNFTFSEMIIVPKDRVVEYFV